MDLFHIFILENQTYYQGLFFQISQVCPFTWILTINFLVTILDGL